MHAPTRILPRSPLLLLLALPACHGDGDDGDGSTGSTGGAGSCPGDPEFFRDEIWEPILGKTCITCHNATGLAKDTRMVLLPADAEGYLEHNLAEAREVAQVDVGGTSLLLLKPTNTASDMHKGGALIPVDSDDYKRLAEFVDGLSRGLGFGHSAEHEVAGSSVEVVAEFIANRMSVGFASAEHGGEPIEPRLDG